MKCPALLVMLLEEGLLSYTPCNESPARSCTSFNNDLLQISGSSSHRGVLPSSRQERHDPGSDGGHCLWNRLQAGGNRQICAMHPASSNPCRAGLQGQLISFFKSIPNQRHLKFKAIDLLVHSRKLHDNLTSDLG